MNGQHAIGQGTARANIHRENNNDQRKRSGTAPFISWFFCSFQFGTGATAPPGALTQMPRLPSALEELTITGNAASSLKAAIKKLRVRTMAHENSKYNFEKICFPQMDSKVNIGQKTWRDTPIFKRLQSQHSRATCDSGHWHELQGKITLLLQ